MREGSPIDVSMELLHSVSTLSPLPKSLAPQHKRQLAPYFSIVVPNFDFPRDQPMSLDFDSARLPNPNIREEHIAWRTQLRKFIDAEIIPHAQDWDEAGHIPIELWPKAAAVGLLGLGYPEEYGGIREGIDSWHSWIANEELARIGVGGIPASLMVHGIGLPPVLNWGSQEMKDRIAPPVLAGEKHIALGITEPGGGSDVAQLTTTAVRDGDHYIVNGSKTYITGGMRANWVSTAVRTGGEGGKGVSMLLIPTDAKGFTRTQLDKKQGWWASNGFHKLFICNSLNIH